MDGCILTVLCPLFFQNLFSDPIDFVFVLLFLPIAYKPAIFKANLNTKMK